ncbi:MAG: aminotransferase class V-fold PLP-dependent enzyme [Pseudomonadales bacterium]
MIISNRRKILKTALAALASAAGTVAAPAVAIRDEVNQETSGQPTLALATADWPSLRRQFSLDEEPVHMACFLLSSHPKQVAAAINRYRSELDRNPAQFLMENDHKLELAVLQSAARYINDVPENVALIRSTTEGLATLLNGISIGPGQEVLTSEHDHYAMFRSLQFSAERNGASVKRIELYDQYNPTSASTDEIVSRIKNNITSKTRVVALTWVHSSSGIKLPIHEIAKVVAHANRGRSEKDRALLCVDGVHGFGVENIDIQHMGCDFFVAGTHKWMFGPRGTGILWSKHDAWAHLEPTVPTFDFNAFLQWMKFLPESPIPGAIRMTPGGTHAYEHRWAMNEAFDFHLEIGKARIAERIHSLNTQLKEGMEKIKGVNLKTPIDSRLSSGITAFEIEGLGPRDGVKTFREHNIIASQSPYAITYTRLTPGIINSEADVDYCLATARKLALA